MIALRSLIVFLAFRTASQAQLLFSIHSDPSYYQIPGDTLVRQQLSSWGIAVDPVKLNVNLGLNVPVRRTSQPLLKVLNVEATGEDAKAFHHEALAVEERRSRMRTRNLSIPKSFGSSPIITASESSGSVISLNVTEKNGSGGWGNDENVAKGEQGDTEVDLASMIRLTEDQLTSIVVHLYHPRLSAPIYPGPT